MQKIYYNEFILTKHQEFYVNQSLTGSMHKGEKELGSRWDLVINSLNTNPDLTIRVNILKTTVITLLMVLRKQGVIAESINGIADALFIKEKINVFRLPSYDTSLFEVQDVVS